MILSSEITCSVQIFREQVFLSVSLLCAALRSGPHRVTKQTHPRWTLPCKHALLTRPSFLVSFLSSFLFRNFPTRSTRFWSCDLNRVIRSRTRKWGGSVTHRCCQFLLSVAPVKSFIGEVSLCVRRSAPSIRDQAQDSGFTGKVASWSNLYSA